MIGFYSLKLQWDPRDVIVYNSGPFQLEQFSATFLSEQFLTLSNLSHFWTFLTWPASKTLKFLPFPIPAVSDTF